MSIVSQEVKKYKRKFEMWLHKQSIGTLIVQGVALVKAAATLKEKDNAAKTEWVVTELTQYAADNGISVKESEIRLAVAYAVAEFKKLFPVEVTPAA